MSKVKRILAVVLAMAMVMAMSVVSFAENGTQTISVSGLASTGTNTVTCYKILTPDVTVTDSGYKFSFPEGVNLGYNTAKEFLTKDVNTQRDALTEKKLANAPKVTGTISGTTWSATVEAGYYAVFITNTAAEGDPQIIYTSPMIVSVEYENAELNGDTYEYDAVIKDGRNSVVAKYTTIPVTKETTSADSTDGVVAIGTTQGYKIETFIPSQAEKFVLTDILTGATYQKDTVDVQIKDVTKADGSTNLADNTTVSYDANGHMVITLTGYLAGNAGKKVTVTYSATVTGTKVGNTVTADDGAHDFVDATTKLYTGAITLTKFGNKSTEDTGTGVDKAGEKRTLLENAVYQVYALNDANKTPLKFTLNNTDGMYYLDPNGENASDQVKTNENGSLTVIGLDLGEYGFKEIQAPEGYSINTTDVTAEITEANITTDTTNIPATPATTEMIDTQLSALPSTGGAGIIVFTIVGCIIMIAAASMFFLSGRKKEE